MESRDRSDRVRVSRRGIALQVSTVALLALVSCSAVLNAPSVAAGGQETIQAFLHGPTSARPVSPNFAGFSIEVPDAPHMVGRYPEPPNSGFINLVRLLKSMSNKEAPILRIGGNSADESWYSEDDAPLPPGNTYRISPDDLLSYQQFYRATGSKFVLGTNFRQGDSAAWGVAHVEGITKHIAWEGISSVEIGNEVDLFKGNGIRNSSFSFADYMSQWKLYDDAYAANSLPQKAVQGATFCCSHNYLDIGPLKQYLDAYKDQMTTLSYHKYPIDACNGNKVSLDELLEEKHGAATAQSYAEQAAASNAAGVPFYLGEGNSCACGGADGVSNVLGSALWSLDYMFGFASTSTYGINFHGGPTGWYAPVCFNKSDPTVPDVRPLFYGMWMFTEATANSSRILNVDVHSTVDNVPVWAVSDENGVVRVVIIHKNATSSEPVSFTVSGSSKWVHKATVLRLTAPGGLTAKTGLSYGGQTFDGTPNGLPQGRRTPEFVSPNSDQSSYTVSVSPHSAVLLTIPPSSEESRLRV